MTGTVSARFVWRMLAAAEADGASVGDLRARLALREEPADDVEQRISALAYLDLWVDLVARAGRALPLRAAERFEPDFVLGFACMTAPTLREALLRFIRWVELWSDVLAWRLEESEDATTVLYRRALLDHPGAGLADEHNLAGVLAIGRRFAGHRWAPREVHFVHSPADARALRAYFDCPIRTGASEVALVVPADVLRRSTAFSEPSMATYFERQLETMRAAHATANDPATLVERLLRAEIATGPPTIGAIAARLGTSERSLRRALAKSGTTYEQVLDVVRKRIGTQLVGATNLRFDEVATLSGFSDATAFYRAFRRWTGETPRTYRASRARTG
jgi:AraC-like DNA-binding protein